MRSRRALHAAGILALAAMLFAQAALALASCELIRRTPAHAMAMALEDAQAARCHEPAKNLNLCLVHCKSDDQTLDKPLVKIPPASLESLPAIRVEHEPQVAELASVRLPTPIAGPPRHILFQSLLI